MSGNFIKVIRAGLWPHIDEASYKYKLMTRNVWVKSNYFKIYAANPFRINLDGETLLTSILRNVRAGEVVYDIGSNVGLYSLSIAQRQPSTSIYAFEPNPETFLKLKANLELNKKLSCNIKPQQIALGNTNGIINFLLSSQHERSSMFEFNATWGNAQVKRKVAVQERTIDSLVAEGRLLPPQHVKIDAEGADPFIIEGALGTISKYLPSVYAEAHGIGSGETNEPKIRELLGSLGYRIVRERRGCICCYPPN